MQKGYNGVLKAISDRLGLSNFKYPVPKYAQTLPYMLGGISLAGFIILIICGIFLAQFYNPNQLSSNESVLYLISRAPFGNFIRSVHYWTANVVFVTILFHMIRVFISGSYKKPREFTWWAGLGLLAITIGFIFTGTMMSLSQEGVEALEHNQEVGHLLGPLGLWLTSGFSSSVPLIGRVYVTHISVLGILFILFIILHIYLIKIHGISPKATLNSRVRDTDGLGESTFSKHLVKLTGWGLILLAVVSLLALVFPRSLGTAGVAGIEITKPPWMFLWLYGFEDVLGIRSLLLGPAIVFFLLAIIPLIDRSEYLSPRRRIWVMVYGAIIMAGLIGLSVQAGLKSAPSNSGDSGFLPKIVPVAYAHNMPFLSFSPTIVTNGQSVTISGDGLQTDGAYRIYLISPKKTVLLGVASVDKGEDYFDQNLAIPADLPGDMYTVEMQSQKDPQFIFYAPLQLAIQPSAVSKSSKKQVKVSYHIPQTEVPWILGFIAVSALSGVLLIRKG